MKHSRRALVGCALVGVLIAGVPVALALSVGSPLPRHIPTGAAVVRALTEGDVSERTLLKVLSWVCWVAWAEMVIAFAVEFLAHRRGRSAPRLPAFGLAQGVAAVLMAAVAPAIGPPDRALREADPAPLARALALSVPEAAESVPATRSGGVREEREVAPTVLPVMGPHHVVARRETLWSIAEVRLGDSMRWREIYDLNEGRPQWDGEALRRPDQQLREGWTLALPDGATAMAGDETASPADAALELRRATEQADAVAARAEVEWKEVAGSLADPVGGPDPLPPPAADGAHPTPALTEPDTGVVDLTGAEEIADDRDMPAREGTLLEGLARAGILVGGFVWSIDRLRRRHESHRLPTAPTPASPPLDQRTELSLRAAADSRLLDLTNQALCQWAAQLRVEGRVVPPVVGVNIAEELSILFAAPDRVPVAGFSVEDDGMSWVTPLDDRDDVAAPGVIHPLPCLATLGHTAQSQVMLNLESLDVISVCGPDPDVEDLLFTMASELVSGPTSLGVRVVAVGLDGDIGDLPGVRSVRTVGEVETELRETAELTARTCAEAGVADALAARIRGASALAPSTVVLAAGLPPDDVARLAGLARLAPRSGVAVVMAGEVPSATWRINVDEGEVRLEPVGVVLRRTRLAESSRPGLCRLLQGPVATMEPASVVAIPVRSDSAAPDGDPEVELCVLGPVEVRGAAEGFSRRKALELVAYLAFHRRGVDADVVSEALWPDRLTSPRTLHGVTSLARRALGGPPDRPLLPHAGPDGHYRVDPSLSVDFERFAALTRVTVATTAEEMAGLRKALSLVTGRPFTVPGGEFLWVHAEALMTAVVSEVADAAHRLATLCLDAGDARGAWWATQQGLLASPGNEQLHRDRMLAADLAGNPAGVEEVIDELCRAVEISRAQLHTVLHPLTVELYERISRRRATRADTARALTA